MNSNGEAHRLLSQSGISLNDDKITAEDPITRAHLLHDRFCLVRKGKKQVALLVFDQ